MLISYIAWVQCALFAELAHYAVKALDIQSFYEQSLKKGGI